jgi:hypothetical protein
MRPWWLLLALPLGACNTEHAPSAKVSTAQMATLHAELKSRHAREFRPTPGVEVTGCAERALGAERADNRIVIYLNRLCATWPARCQADTDESAGESGPAVAYLQDATVERVQCPGAGSRDKRDNDAWVPKSIRKAATFPGNDVVNSMETAARKDAGCTQ